MPEFSPTFIKVDPVTGLTYYDFEGHIQANGLDLDTASDLTTIGSTIRWLSAVNTAAQQIWGSRLRFIDRLPREDVSTLRLQAFKPDVYSGPTLSAFSEVVVAATETETGVDRGNITATVGANNRKILDQAGASDFAQNGTNFAQLRFYGQFSVGPFNIPANSGISAAFTQVGLFTGWQVFGMVLDDGSASNATDWVTWSLFQSGTDTITFKFVNQHSAVSARFQFYFFIIANH